MVPRAGTYSVKWDFLPAVEGKRKDELLSLSIADMDFACAEPILDALHARVDRRIFGYSRADADMYLSVVRRWFKERFQWEFDAGDIHPSPGVVPALAILVKSLTAPGDGIIVQQPVYYPFMSVIKNNGRRILNNALLETDGYYTIDFEDLEQKASRPDTTMLILCSPHNPVGRVWAERELATVAGICLEHDVVVVSDEIHCDITRDGVEHLPLARVNPDKRIITCTSASKSFNLAGLQTANIIIRDEELREKWRAEIHDRSGLFGINPFGIVATETAYRHGARWLDEANRYIDANLRFVEEFLCTHLPKAVFRIPEGTYLAWIDLRAYRFSARELEDKMKKDAGLLLDEGYIFGEAGDGFERINVACPRSVLKECLVRMKATLLTK